MNSFMQSGYCPYGFYPPPIFNPYYNLIAFPNSDYEVHSKTATNMPNQAFSSVFSRRFEETAQPNARIRRNVVLSSEEEEKLEEVEVKRNETKRAALQEKSKVLCVQKDNRNVASNLLRIFFKNILEVASYESQINTLIQKAKIEATAEDFYLWLEKFKVNFKNYIKPGEVKRVLTAKKCEGFQKIFRTLLRHFMSEMGLSHCLTSKRIGQACTQRHLDGLRKLLVMGN